METPHRTPSGAQIVPCDDELACTVVSCAVCLKEIPADAARLADPQDYVHYFCGLDCLEKWREQAASRTR